MCEHDISGQPHVACSEYILPAHINPHVDFITPTLHFDAKNKFRNEHQLQTRQIPPTVKPGTGHGIGIFNGWKPKLRKMINLQGIALTLQMCATIITPNCLRTLYDFTGLYFGQKLNKDNSCGIIGYIPQAYVPLDLDLFLGVFNTLGLANDLSSTRAMEVQYRTSTKASDAMANQS